MEFETHIVSKPLSDFIESVFHYKGFQPDHSIERVVPTGHIFVIFELDGFERKTYDNSTLEANATFSKVWVSGNHSNYLTISAHQDSKMLVVQLKPYGFYPFIHQDISELNNKVIAAQEIFGLGILNLRNQLVNQELTQEKFSLVENWLLERLDISKAPSNSLNQVFEELRIKPIGNHKNIISSYPKTQKHLIHQFKKYYGLTPKVFHRIFRFNEILKQIQNKQNISWTQIAYEFGYVD